MIVAVMQLLELMLSKSWVPGSVLCKALYGGFQNEGYHFGGAQNKDYSILGQTWGPLAKLPHARCKRLLLRWLSRFIQTRILKINGNSNHKKASTPPVSHGGESPLGHVQTLTILLLHCILDRPQNATKK